MRARVLAPELDRPARFKRVFGGHPSDLCAEISRLGVPMSQWGVDPFVAGFWYCASDLAQIGPEGSDGRRSTLFVNLRGQGEDRLNTVRIKLSADNPATAGAARASLFRVLDAVGTRYGWPWPDVLESAVREGRSLDVAEFGLRMRVVPEDPALTGDAADVLRLNLILTFSGVDLLAPAELFAPFAWDAAAEREGRARPMGGATLLPEQ